MVLVLISTKSEVRCLLKGRFLLESSAYFDEDNQSCVTYLRSEAY